MKKIIIAIFLFTTTPAWAQLDGVMGVETSRAGSTIHYAEWKLIAHAEAIYPEFSETWQRPEPDGTITFLLSDNAELATVKSNLTRYGIKYDLETKVELTSRQKALLDGAGLRSRADVPRALERLELIDAATTVAELKAEVLKSAATRSR